MSVGFPFKVDNFKTPKISRGACFFKSFLMWITSKPCKISKCNFKTPIKLVEVHESKNLLNGEERLH